MTEQKTGSLETLRKSLQDMGQDLTEKQEKQFLMYYELLVEWNRKINLTAITEFEEVSAKHFLDSLLLYRVPEVRLTGSLIDIGTGAGFPGIPLSIMNPELHVTLLDSLRKRVSFLEICCRELGLQNTAAVHARAEDAARNPDMREQYDFAVSRAVAALPVLSEYCLPFVKMGGYFIAYKSQKAAQEMNEAAGALDILGGEILTDKKMILPGTDAERTLIVIRKKKTTPAGYPRKAGIPEKKPL